MSARPGAPEGVEDILTEILVELRAIRARLDQEVIVTDAFSFEVEESAPLYRYRAPQGRDSDEEPARLAAQELRP